MDLVMAQHTQRDSDPPQVEPATLNDNRNLYGLLENFSFRNSNTAHAGLLSF